VFSEDRRMVTWTVSFLPYIVDARRGSAVSQSYKQDCVTQLNSRIGRVLGAEKGLS